MLIDIVHDALAELIQAVPFGSLNMFVEPKPKEALCIPHKINELRPLACLRGQWPENPQNNAQKSPMRQFLDFREYYSKYHLFFKDIELNKASLATKKYNAIFAEILIMYWTYAFILKQQGGDCVQLSRGLYWILKFIFQIQARIEIVSIYKKSSTNAHLEMNAKFRIKKVCHRFLVINRVQGEGNDISSWNPDAIIVDPWYRVFFTADKWPVFQPLLFGFNWDILNKQNPKGSHVQKLSLDSQFLDVISLAAQTIEYPWKSQTRDLYAQVCPISNKRFYPDS